MAVIALFHPRSNYGFRFTTHMSFYPLVIHIGSVDEVTGMCAIGIHHCMGLGFIGIGAKDVAAKAQRMNYEVGLRDSDHARTVREAIFGLTSMSLISKPSLKVTNSGMI